MGGLKYVNDQLEFVSRHPIDSGGHDAVTASLDADLAFLNQKVNLIGSLHGALIELDAIAFRALESGGAAPDAGVCELFLRAVDLFRRAGSQVLAEAEAFTRKGVPVVGLAALRRITADPGAGLGMVELANAARQMDAGGGPPPEVPFADEVLESLAGAGKAFRNLE